MKKSVAFSMALLLVAFSMLKNTDITAYATFGGGGFSSVSLAPVPTVAEGTTLLDNGMVCATANVLTWEMLQTYLYAVTGQQAYDVYTNNEEEQEKLYSDFVDFCQETSYGSQVAFKMNVNTVASTTLSQYALLTDVLNYYKTAGSSALSDINNTTKAQLKVIMGGNNNLTPAPTNGAGSDLVGNLKNMELIGNSALTYYIGQYISKLVNGERGEVSETFLNTVDVPELYFDGEYLIGADGCFHMLLKGSYLIKTATGKYETIYTGTNQLKFIESGGHAVDETERFAFLASGTYIKEGIEYSCMNYYRYEVDDESSVEEKKGINSVYMLDNGKFTLIGYGNLYVSTNSLVNIKYVPVFDNEISLQKYLLTGDYSECINFFEAEVKPANWLNFDYSQISSKLDKILSALTTLPIITTDDLTGFAQGVASGVAAGNIPASDPATQQQLMERLLEEQARQTASESMATATENDLLPDYDNTVPLPTRTPEQEQQAENIKDAKMVVDLHEFFPFCVPFDLVRLIKVLHAEPKAPCFETAIKYDKLNINVPIKLDLSLFDEAARVFRLCEIILFILSLILVTRNIIRG